uniref:Uncharacterized protein n=1 Tax=Anopheles farauti TaxID=69004 RepID=A0A182QLF5_9DIPT
MERAAVNFSSTTAKNRDRQRRLSIAIVVAYVAAAVVVVVVIRLYDRTIARGGFGKPWQRCRAGDEPPAGQYRNQEDQCLTDSYSRSVPLAVWGIVRKCSQIAMQLMALQRHSVSSITIARVQTLGFGKRQESLWVAPEKVDHTVQSIKCRSLFCCFSLLATGPICVPIG